MDRSRYNFIEPSGGTILVAANNAPDIIKRRADYICDGTADDVQIQAAIDSVTVSQGALGAAVALSMGQFNIASTINLKIGMRLFGGGINVTTLKLAADVDMFKFNDVGGTFCEITHMLLDGDKNNRTAGAGLYAPTQCKDMILRHLFFQNFSDEAIDCWGSWGWILDDVVIEFCEGDGAVFNRFNTKLLTGAGVLNEAFVVGEWVTATGSGATGRVRVLGGLGAATVEVYEETGTFAVGDVINSDNTTAQMPALSAVSYVNSIGPKIVNCKIYDNDGHDLVIGPKCDMTMITNSEFKANSGKYAIYCMGKESIINGNRFQAMDSGSSGFIGLDKDATVGTSAYRSVINNNFFDVQQASTPGVHFIDATVVGNLVSNNVFLLAASGIPWKADVAWRQGVNKTWNNLIEDSDEDITHNWIYETLYNGTFTLLDYHNGTLFNNDDHTGSQQVTLPAAEVGMEFTFLVTVAQQIQINPNGTETTNKTVGGAQEAAGKYIYSSTIGDFIRLQCIKAGQWECMAVVGTWSVEV